ncbi:probable lipase MIL1 isoform X2 [Impatiens glandulifera]|uniref:probable lipase MIL1 isoform X2 n=1 Tax=Impatiens glandulifera TaxID=253017 RepID=UPI001FB14A9C|nr:probable lipase MIL1 isoform X2 [Impatiens glandulifera]
MTTLLAPSKRYAAGGLLGLALHQAQLHQTHPLHPLDMISNEEDEEPVKTSDSLSDGSDLWVHENFGLLRPVFRILEIPSKSWPGLEETAQASPAKRYVEGFLSILSEESNDTSQEMKDTELELLKALEAMSETMEKTRDVQSELERHQEYKNDCQQKYRTNQECSSDEGHGVLKGNDISSNCEMVRTEEAGSQSSKGDEKSLQEANQPSRQRKVTVLYELLSACLAPTADEDKNSTGHERGYDSRHRVALRLLASWFQIKLNTMEAIQTMIAFSAMALSEENGKDEEGSSEDTWKKWKHGGIVGAAAITGGTLLAITGGLAAPAIAAGLNALAPTLGFIIPVVGASGFAAAASAAGTVAGSVAVAASFGAAGAGLTGTKMARRIGSVDEFEFKVIGENENQGRLAVEIVISGFVFKEEDFVKPWEGQNDRLERYALQWESENLIAVSTAIQDWLTSNVALGLMRQGAMMTVLSSLVTALAWPATLLAATDFIDSKWTISLDRSDKAGKLLAEVLMKGLQGDRFFTRSSSYLQMSPILG